jgi:hypothetical protein
MCMGSKRMPLVCIRSYLLVALLPSYIRAASLKALAFPDEEMGHRGGGVGSHDGPGGASAGAGVDGGGYGLVGEATYIGMASGDSGFGCSSVATAAPTYAVAAPSTLPSPAAATPVSIVAASDKTLLDVRDLHGNTPTSWAVRTNQLEMLTFLLHNSADAISPNLELVAPIHFACMLYADPHVANTLLATGVNVNAVDGDGNTPLMHGALEFSCSRSQELSLSLPRLSLARALPLPYVPHLLSLLANNLSDTDRFLTIPRTPPTPLLVTYSSVPQARMPDWEPRRD